MDESIGNQKTMVGVGGTDRHAELRPGQRLGRYEILRLLGKGGMGQVYLVRHELQRSLHALKILPAVFSGRPGFLERFRTELQTMANMQHPNIVHVQYSDVEGDRHYLVMDFVAADDGEEPYDLEEALAEEKRFSPVTVRRLGLQVCQGLAYAHGKGVVHRDLKPANVLLTSKILSVADVKICDFGLAKVVGEKEVHSQMTASLRRSMSLGGKSTYVETRRGDRDSEGVVLGTYGYMSPEQEEGRPADERSDIYALGVMFYRMLTGERLRGMAKPASRMVQGLDPAWDRIIGRCLETAPDARWQTVKELSLALERIGSPQGQGVVERKWVEVRPSSGFLQTLLRGVATVVHLLLRGVGWLFRGSVVTGKKLVAVIGSKRIAWGLCILAAVLLSYRGYAGFRAYLEKQRTLKIFKNEEAQREKFAEREFGKIYPEASKIWEETQVLSRSQPYGLSNVFRDYWYRVERAREQKQWAEGIDDCQQLIAMCVRYKDSLSIRNGSHAPGGVQVTGTANGTSGSDSAVTMRNVQNYRKMRAQFENQLTADAALLTQYGGAKWLEVKREQQNGEKHENDPAEGLRAYAAALLALPAAVAEAKEAWSVAQARQEEAVRQAQAVRDAENRQAQAAREAENRRAQEEQREKAWQAAVAPVLAAARAAKSAARWEDVLKQTARVLQLGKERLAAEPSLAGNGELAEVAEARALQTGAEQALARQRAEARAALSETALTAARAAKGAAQWAKVIEQTERIFLLEAERLADEPEEEEELAAVAEARVLQAEARQAMIPRWTLIVEAEGREVAADISDGRNRYPSPSTFDLREGGSYVFNVTYTDVQGGAHFENKTLRLSADWQGARTNRVTLKRLNLPVEGAPWTSSATGMQFVWVPVLRLWVGKYEVTNGEYRKKDPGHESKAHENYSLDGDRQPVVYVNFDDAEAYGVWLTRMDGDKLGGLRYRMISESEWNACAQCGDGRVYPWGNSMPPKWGNYSDSASPLSGKISGYADGYAVTCPVEKSGVNEWGLYGIGGNVWECCATDSSGGCFGAWRGSSWYSFTPASLQCTCRGVYDGSYRSVFNGFRLVLSR